MSTSTETKVKPVTEEFLGAATDKGFADHMVAAGVDEEKAVEAYGAMSKFASERAQRVRGLADTIKEKLTTAQA